MLVAVADWTQIGMFWVTVALTATTIGYVAVTYLMLRAQHDPRVIVYTRSDKARPQLIMIVIENIGKSVAKDVHFTLSEPLQILKGGDWRPLDSGPLIAGIPALAPGESRMFLWGPFLGLWPVIGTRAFTVTAAYTCDSLGWVAPEQHEDVSVIEVASFHITDAVDTDGARQTAKQVERIADLLDRSHRDSE